MQEFIPVTDSLEVVLSPRGPLLEMQKTRANQGLWRARGVFAMEKGGSSRWIRVIRYL